MLFNPTNRTRKAVIALMATGLLGGAVGAVALQGSGPQPSPPAATQPADAARAATPVFSDPTNITNPWMPFSTQKQVVLTGKKEGMDARSVRTVLDRTKTFAVHGQKVEAKIVKDSAYQNGTLHEVALDYYAQADDGTVYYLGEDVDIYDKPGTRVVNHDGAFLYGRDTQTLGVAMPGTPREGQRFTFERIPGQGSETNRVSDTNARPQLTARTFDGVLKIDGMLLPEKESEVKYYAKGVGLVKEQAATGGVELASVR